MTSEPSASRWDRTLLIPKQVFFGSAQATPPPTFAHRLAIAACVFLLILSATGCQPGIQWRAYNYNADAVERDAGQKSRFVYFRHWAVPDCTKFEETVLLDPAVKNATNAYYCIVLAYNVDKHLAETWSVSEPPGVAILGPDGKLLASGSGFMKREDMLALFQKADKERSATGGAPGAGGSP